MCYTTSCKGIAGGNTRHQRYYAAHKNQTLYQAATSTKPDIRRLKGMIHLSIALKNRREACKKVKPKRLNRKDMILEVLTSGDPGGMTADEIGDCLVAAGKIHNNSPGFTRPRLSELKEEGKVMIVGKRPGKSGCSTLVWKVVKR